MSQYLVIPRIEVKGANAQSAWWLVSGPSPLAWIGLTRKLAIDLGVADHHKINVIILHHDLEMRGELFYGVLHPGQLRGGALTVGKNGSSKDYVAGGMAMGLQPVALCNLTTSLIIEGMEDIDVEQFRSRLLRSRLAGGTIQSCGPIKPCAWSDIHAYLGNGFFLKNRSDLLDDIPGDQRIGALMRHLHESRSGVNEEGSWLIPMNLGYLPITPVSPKSNARLSIPHAYAEPLVGLVQYISKRALADNQLSELFWGYAKDGDAFVVKHI